MESVRQLTRFSSRPYQLSEGQFHLMIVNSLMGGNDCLWHIVAGKEHTPSCSLRFGPR
jgi:hypothetical protein